MLLTNCGDERFTEIDNCHDVFDGIFCTAGQGRQHTGKYANHFEVEDSKVASHGDHDLDYDKTIAFLQGLYPSFTEEQIDALYEFTAEESSNVGDDDLDVFDGEFDCYEEWEVSFMFQNIRGQIAANQEFDAIEMDDEYGTSYFLPYGSKAVYTGSEAE